MDDLRTRLALAGIRAVAVTGLIWAVIWPILSYTGSYGGFGRSEPWEPFQGLVLIFLLVVLHWRMVMLRRWAVVGSCLISWATIMLFAGISVAAATRGAEVPAASGELPWDLLFFFVAAAFMASLITAAVLAWPRLQRGF